MRTVLLSMLCACTPPDAGRAPRDAAVVDAAPGQDLGEVDATTARLDAEAVDGAPADGSVDGALDAGPAMDAAADARADARADAEALDAAPPDLGRADAGCVIEACSGRDEDCDGRVDEGSACADWAVTHCRASLGFAPAEAAPPLPAEAWAGCPEEEADLEGPRRCASSRGTGRFHALPLGAPPGAGAVIALAWRCGGPDPELAAWATGRCRILLAHTAGGSGGPPFAGRDPADCPPGGPDWRCVSTAGDGRFHGIALPGPLDGDDSLGLAFACADEARPHRAAGLMAHVSIWLATQYRHETPEACLDEALFDDSEVWGACPAEPVDAEGRHRCAASPADGAIRGFPLNEEGGLEPAFGRCSGLGLAVRRAE